MYHPELDQEPCEVFMQMTIKETAIPGCYEILSRIISDERGSFVKTFHQTVFQTHNLNTVWLEEYYSVSYSGIIRGLHFQLPPHDHEKLVYCSSGSVLDAVVDLRKGSPTYGQHILLELSAGAGNMLYLPKGLAHGFFVTNQSATMHYKVSTQYSPEHDTGILWNSVGIAWPEANPVLSARDKSFLRYSEFTSPFTF
jgi:dTDP-4-dehydrorhamnose 3,5-epimerase